MPQESAIREADASVARSGGTLLSPAAFRSAPWAGLLALGAWTAGPSPWWLALATATLLLGLPFVARTARSRWAVVGALLALTAVPVGFWAHHRMNAIQGDWDAYWARREAGVFGHLERELADLVERGDAAATALATLVEESDGRPPVEAVETLRRERGFPAVAVYSAEGELRLWDGTHRGRVPEEVQFGLASYMYGELPLFSHLYFTEPLPQTGGTAVVATLLRTDLPETLRTESGDLVSRLSDLTGERIRITRPERVGNRVAYDLVWGEGPVADTLFSVTVEEPTPLERLDRVELRWVRVVLALLAGAWLLLAWGRTPTAAQGLGAGLTLLILVLLVPFDLVGREAVSFGPAAFFLPGPLGLTLERVLAALLVLTGLGAFLSPRVRSPSSALGGAVTVTVALPLVVLLISAGASPGLLAGEDTPWVVFQLVLAVALTLPVAVALVVGVDGGAGPARSRGTGLLFLVGGLILAGLLASGAAAWTRAHAGLPVWVAAAWGLPAFLVIRGLEGWDGWRRTVLLWTAAGVLGTSAALPAAWADRTEARMAVAERRMERLGADVDPYLHFLLERLAETVRSQAGTGATPVELLYRGWVDSGLAREGHPVWLTLWSPNDVPREELPVGVPSPRPGVAMEYLADARAADTTAVRRFRLPEVHYLATVPLDGGTVVTAVIPPRREFGGASPVGPLFGSVTDAGRDPLTLVPLFEGDVSTRGGTLTWVRSQEGWRGEMFVEYPGARYHAHYVVDLPGPLVRTARGTLLLVLNLAVLLGVWTVGRVLLLRPGRPGPQWRSLFTSFRARVTVALFGFFVLSNAIFGTVAYRTISGAAQRAAGVLAEQVVEDAVGVYFEEGGSMSLLAQRVGTDLLEYRGGELREGSTEELVELGLYEGWVPYDVHRELAARENVSAVRQTRLGPWDYVIAYRLGPDGDLLGAPVPLQAGATAVRRQEVAHLLGFALVAGAGLSLLLALLVGRTLTRPIRTLQVASERVGSGNLGVRLPGARPDEFDAVFTAFNRMVRRLRKARRELVRTTRRTQAIVEDAASGVIALDATGRVTLVNPRAAELLEREITVGSRLRERGDVADEFVRWVELYFRDGLREAGTDFQFGERRIRVQARRISRRGPLEGAVLSLEDVTDELRSERVLAWGEMARQVAHEVKNPLTPIKLAIQHIRRAWEDRRADFDEILGRNAEAALREIDRLATIASSFSRFGAPEEAGRSPLRPVDLAVVVDQVLALYETGEGPIRFKKDVADDFPPVKGRETELKEVLVNLLENARSAIEEEGVVRVEGERTPQGVVLRVRDDGSGIEEEFLSRIFEPHFSTRSTGTGLGLAIVKRLVESWDGAVTVESESGTGTVVHLWLREWGPDEAPRSDSAGSGDASDGPPV